MTGYGHFYCIWFWAQKGSCLFQCQILWNQQIKGYLQMIEKNTEKKTPDAADKFAQA